MDLSWLGEILMFLLILAIVIGIIYALRHIIPWIAGVLVILSLVSALASAPSCSGPTPITVTPEKTTEYCWFWDSCFWQQLFGSNDSVVLKPTVIEPVKVVEAKVSPPEFTEHVIQRGDTLWKLAGGYLDQVEAIALLNAGVLDPYWIKNCHHISKKTNKWCAEPKHTLQIGMRIFIPIRK
ncbi:LysM peptidoglycan-binding domain-containing protein [Candidatus Peregrinibacteria bacterium]|nr:LysM peptidoglycan-binding domain-containing protein [Candidatus Peregrinibacteria bacterium]